MFVLLVGHVTRGDIERGRDVEGTAAVIGAGALGTRRAWRWVPSCKVTSVFRSLVTLANFFPVFWSVSTSLDGIALRTLSGKSSRNFDSNHGFDLTTAIAHVARRALSMNGAAEWDIALLRARRDAMRAASAPGVSTVHSGGWRAQALASNLHTGFALYY